MGVPFGLVATFDPGATLLPAMYCPQTGQTIENWFPASETNFTFSVVSPVGTTLLVLQQRMRIADILDLHLMSSYRCNTLLDIHFVSQSAPTKNASGVSFGPWQQRDMKITSSALPDATPHI